MGKVLSVASRKAKRFNVENRAHKVISMDKPAVAPKHPSSQRELDQIRQDYGYVFDELKSKNVNLDENLKRVYVTSTIDEVSKFGKPSDKSKLPLNRTGSNESEFGYREPEVIPEGKVTLKQMLQVLANIQAAPEILTNEKIAQELNISLTDAGNLVKYFTAFKVHMPEAVPQISKAEKARKILLRQLGRSETESIEESVTNINLKNPAKNIRHIGQTKTMEVSDTGLSLDNPAKKKPD